MTIRHIYLANQAYGYYNLITVRILSFDSFFLPSPSTFVTWRSLHVTSRLVIKAEGPRSTTISFRTYLKTSQIRNFKGYTVYQKSYFNNCLK